MNMKKTIAALMALCLALSCAMGALAEGGLLNDLLGFFGGKSEPEPAPEAQAEAAPAAESSGPWQNVLLLGTDSRTEDAESRTDTMIVLSLNSETKEIRMTSLMRDIWLDIPGHGGAKLNAACVYGGPELTVKTINQYFGLDIQAYVLVNMECLAKIVDALGGIQMDVSEEEAAAINRLFADDRAAKDENSAFAGTNVTAGSQVMLDGKQALGFARIRSLDNDYARTERQRRVLVTIAKQLQQQDVLSLTGIIINMLQYVETNISLDDLVSLATTCTKANLDEMPELRLPAEGTYQAGTYGSTWCIKADYPANAEALRQFIYEG